MSLQVLLAQQIEGLDPALRAVLGPIVETLDQHREVMAQRADFSRLQALVEQIGRNLQDLTESGQRIDARLDRLAEAQRESQARWEADRKARAEAEARLDARINESRNESEARWQAYLKERAEADARIDASLNRLSEAQQRTDERFKQLAAAQERTDERLDRLTAAQERTEERLDRLAAAQERTEVAMAGMLASQARMETSMAEMQEAIAQLARQGEAMRGHLGGLSRSVAYALENDAYRLLPAVLAQHGIEVTERMVRATLEEREINLLARARRGDQEVLVVGEAELRLDDDAKLGQLRKHLELAERHYGMPLVPVLITHYAAPRQLETARSLGVLVVQSFEWL